MPDETDLYVVAVAALIFRDGKVLAMRRAATKDAGPGLWETLSGRIAAGEEPFDAVKREISEECGLEVTVSSHPFTAYQAHRNAQPMVVIVYRAEYRSGEVIMSEEHDAYAWLTPAEFAQRSILTKLVEAVKTAVETEGRASKEV
ncbi:MAG: NUDIX domain-containing protein [Trueperaceae bacterium]|nr:MAG: NUDIX domain-containing protein [Trueperaceae bacterium]